MSKSYEQIATAEWSDIIEPMLPIAGRLVNTLSKPEDVQLRQELYRAVFSAIAGAYPSLVLTDPKYPDFIPSFGQFLNVLGPNPDFIYHMCAIDGKGVYKISGRRGSTRLVILQVAGGTFVTKGDEQRMGEVFHNHDLDSLNIAEDGSFEVILSASRPAGHTGDWWPMDEQSTNLVLRQFSYDWLNEVDAKLAIDRLDTPALKPRPTANEITEQLKQIAIWAEGYVANSIRFSHSFEEQGGINKVGFLSFTGDGGMPAQRYMEGFFDLADDEALILETDVPSPCRYWSFHLTDERWTTLDWFNRKTSINGAQAVLDSDGRFRAVISPVDPGVPNWLDTIGYNRGVIQGRWNKCETFPMPEFTKVKVGDVRKHLPADTAVMTPEERDAEIRLRRKGCQLRKRW